MDFDLVPRDDFARRYGPWAVVAGGCEEIGAALARGVAAHGIRLFLIDQNPEPLVALSRSITAASQVEVRAAPLDLTAAADLLQVTALTAGLEVGLFIYDSGPPRERGRLVEQPLDPLLRTIQRNVIGPAALCHHYAPPMVRRGRGGIILIGSIEGCAGCAGAATYSGSKAFEQIFIEGLWHELKPFGVNALCCIAAYTPPSAQGTASNKPRPSPASEIISREALEHLTDGPIWFAGEDNRASAQALCTPDRRAASELISEASSDKKTVN
jgi:short-subunit dehydrogenase